MKRYERFTSIPGKFHARPGTRVGKIHTGLPKTPDGKWGKEVDYFVLDFDAVDELGEPDPAARAAAEAVARVYGEKPRALEAVFLGKDLSDCAPYEYKKYGASRRPVCRGNGEFCIRKVMDQATKEVEMVRLPCPSPEACDFARDEKGRTVCSMITNFTILLPRVSLFGTYQIDTKSYHAQSNFQDWAESVKAVIGRIRGVPVVITRPPHRSELDGGGYSTHYPLKFTSPANQQFKALLGSFLAARNLIVQAEARVPVLEGPSFPFEAPDDVAPDHLVARHLADAPSPDHGTDDGGPQIDLCRTCKKVLCDQVDIDAKTGEVSGECLRCHEERIAKNPVPVAGSRPALGSAGPLPAAAPTVAKKRGRPRKPRPEDTPAPQPPGDPAPRSDATPAPAPSGAPAGGEGGVPAPDGPAHPAPGPSDRAAPVMEEGVDALEAFGD